MAYVLVYNLRNISGNTRADLEKVVPKEYISFSNKDACPPLRAA